MDGAWRWNDTPDNLPGGETALAPVEQTAPELDTGEKPAYVANYTSGLVYGRGYGFDGAKWPGAWGEDYDRYISYLVDLDYYELRRRSSQLFQTNPYARGIIRRLVTNEVNTGLDLEARPVSLLLPDQTDEQLEEWSDTVEAYWGAYTNAPGVCDYEKRPDMTLGELTAMARREALVGGDCLVVMRTGETGLPNVQLFGGHLVVQPLQVDLPEGREVINGVEIDESGRHIAYYLARTVNQYGATLETTRIEANAPDGTPLAWLMYGTDRRLGAVRGEPLLSIVLQSLKDIDRFRDSTQRKALVNSILAMWIEKTEDRLGSLPISQGAVRAGEVPSSDFDGSPRRFRLADQMPGFVAEELQTGEKPHIHSTNTAEATSFPEFEAALISSILWACEIPPEIGVLSFNANYSASQAANNEFKIYLDVTRHKIGKSFHQKIYTQWMRASIMRGSFTAPGYIESLLDINRFETTQAWTNAAWIGAIKPTTDMLKLVKAMEIAVDRGWTTNARVARELTGTKFQTNAKVLAREREELPMASEEPAPPANNMGE